MEEREEGRGKWRRRNKYSSSSPLRMHMSACMREANLSSRRKFPSREREKERERNCEREGEKEIDRERENWRGGKSAERGEGVLLMTEEISIAMRHEERELLATGKFLSRERKGETGKMRRENSLRWKFFRREREGERGKKLAMEFP